MRFLHPTGQVASVNPRHPGIPARALYYLRPAGAKRLSVERRRGRPRFVERIADVYELRNFWISSQRAGVSVQEWQVLTPAMRGVSLHGVAQTTDRRWLVVEWDRGERPVRLYKHRLRRVAALAGNTGAGLLLVAADGARGTAMLYALAGHLDAPGPHMGLTTRALIASQGVAEATCYLPALGDTISLQGFVDTLPDPWGDRPLLSQGILSFSGEWQGNAQLMLALSPLEKVLLSTLASLPLTSAHALSVLCGRSEGRIERSLREMKAKGLVHEYRHDPNRLLRHYYPSRTGLAFLAATCGAPLGAYARARSWSIQDGRVSARHLTRTFQHSQESRELALAFARAAVRRPTPVTWYDEKEAYAYFTIGGEFRVLAPDARVNWGQHVFYVEVDRGTSSPAKVAKKLTTYYEFQEYAEYRRFGKAFCVLVVAPLTGRERQWLDIAAELAEERHRPPLSILTTYRDAVRKHGVNGAIWRGVRDMTERGGLPVA